MTKNEIIQKIKTTILAHSKTDASITEITNNEWLFHDNWNINEQSIIHFIEALEQAFQLHFSDEEITSKNFESVQNISQLIDQKSNRKPFTENSQNQFQALTGATISVALIDSGVQAEHPAFAHTSVTGYEFQNGLFHQSNPRDRLGHGTACAYILTRKAPAIKIYSLRVFEDELKARPESVLAALRWCLEKGVHIINASLGTVHETLREQLVPLVAEAYRQNIVIVAAKNNLGKTSFPADLEHVLCVESAPVYEMYGYYYQSGNNFSARGDLQKVAWCAGQYRLSSGTSLAAAHLSGIIAQLLEKHDCLPFEELTEVLKNNALPLKKEHSCSTRATSVSIQAAPELSEKTIQFIQQAAVYPADRNSAVFLKYREMLPFQLSALVGIPGLDLGNHQAGVTNIEHVIEEIDTIIVGNLNWPSRIKRVDLYEKIFQTAVKYSKNILVYGDIQIEKYAKYAEMLNDKRRFLSCTFSPYQIDRYLKGFPVPQNYRVKAPVLGLFTVDVIPQFFEYELQLRQLLTGTGYHVRQLGTDSRGLLFGFDDICPPVSAGQPLTNENIIKYLQVAVKELDKNRPDVILTGCPVNFLMDRTNPLRSAKALSFIIGCQPDACILVAKAGTESEKIERAVNLLTSLVEAAVIFIIYLPLTTAETEKTTPKVSIPGTCSYNISQNKSLLTAIQDHFSA